MQKNSVFFGLNGSNEDGSLYAEDAIKNGALGGKLLGAGGGGFFLFYVPYSRQKYFVNYFKKLINVPFKFSSEGSKIMFKNIDKEVN